MNHPFKSGFVNIFGPPNAGKSTLLNALLGQQLAIISPKVQTTRHRILGFVTEDNYQIIFSDTPGIIEPHYKLHQRMMNQVQNAVEDADVALLMMSINDNPQKLSDLWASLKLKTKQILFINKTDLIKDKKERQQKIKLIKDTIRGVECLPVSVLKGKNVNKIIPTILKFLPEHPPYFPEDNISDRPTRFFISEFIREQIYFLFEKEIPYHTAVLIQTFEELPDIIKIRADIIVTRDTQKRIVIGRKGTMIKQLGINARKRIEAFLNTKVYLELFVKVRPKWRQKEPFLREYGY